MPKQTYRVVLRVFQDYEIEVEADDVFQAENLAIKDYDLLKPIHEDIEILDSDLVEEPVP